MLIDNFFSIVHKESSETDIKALISFNSNHSIFKGHFPNMPIVPGVCMIQIVRELAEVVLNVKLTLRSSDTIKFLSPINPTEVKQVNVTLTYKIMEGRYAIQSALSFNDVTYFKFKGIFAVN